MVAEEMENNASSKSHNAGSIVLLKHIRTLLIASFCCIEYLKVNTLSNKIFTIDKYEYLYLFDTEWFIIIFKILFIKNK